MNGIRRKVWHDLIDSKMGDEYISLYLIRERRIRKKYRIFLWIILSIGIGVWNFWEPMPLISCIIVLGSEIIIKLENPLLMSDEDMSRLGDLRLLYVTRFNKLTRLWIDINDGSTDYDNIKERYFIIQDEKNQIEQLDNKSNIPPKEKIKTKAQKLTQNFINNYHG